MSKDNTNLRLLGSPVNLSYRGKKKSDRNNIRNRPRSALQNSSFTSPENFDRYKRPFSADTKERVPNTRNVLNVFGTELFDPFNNELDTIKKDYSTTNIKILPPTTDLLEGSRSAEGRYYHLDKDCISEHGSEDTFVSLGTKIKARAQLHKPKNDKNLKYRNSHKKGQKSMEGASSEDKTKNNDYGMEVKITEKSRSPSPCGSRDRPRSPYKTRVCESYFLPLDSKHQPEESLAGRVSFGSSSLQDEVEQAIDTYSRRLTLTKQQLSLVEEESTHDIDSLAHNIPSLSPDQNNEGNMSKRTYFVDSNEEFPKTQTFMSETRTYNSFYDDFNSSHANNFQAKMSSTVEHRDSSSKDSGYAHSGSTGDKDYKTDYSLPTADAKRYNSQSNIQEQPKSLDMPSADKKYLKTFPMDKKSQWAEPLNHSRLLYKDFFLKKEGHTTQPQNSPEARMHVQNVPETSENQPKAEGSEDNLQYPTYLLNSTTKAYTSKVIEDYKKELEAINSLHELTIKDIKTDAVSPTPLNIDSMFEQYSSTFERPQSSHSIHKELTETEPTTDKNVLENTKEDISKVTTKELIQNYFKVKEGDQIKSYLPKNLLKYDKRVSRAIAKFELYPGQKQDWNNKPENSNAEPNLTPPKALNIRNQTQKNLYTLKTNDDKRSLSARIESVQNDRDVDSWMSIATSSPRATQTNVIEEKQTTSLENQPLETEPTNYDHEGENQTPETNDSQRNNQAEKPAMSPIDADTPKHPENSYRSNEPQVKTGTAKELDPNATVLDIYTMLKEIESLGDQPADVTSSARTVNESGSGNDGKEKAEERTSTPKDSYMEIFEFLEKVEQSANDALSVVTSTTAPTVPKLDQLLKLPHTELAQRLVTASLQLDERSCCIALLQESLTNHKEQMIHKVGNLEKQAQRNIARVKQDCEETIKRHQTFIDQLINDKKTLNHRIEQLVDERRALEERWKRSAHALEERYKLELRNQHDKMAAAQQVARQRWVRQKAEKIKELTVKGLEGELREMAERQQKEVSDLKMCHAEQVGRMQAKHNAAIEELRRSLEEEKEAALVKERQIASSRLEKQILELELTYQEQRTRLVAEMRAENERVAAGLTEKERMHRKDFERWKEEQEKLIEQKRSQMELEIEKEKERLEEQMRQKQKELEQKFEQFKKEFEAEQQVLLKKKVTEIAAQHKQERDREIEKAIESMEAEAQAGRRELQEAMRRNKEQYEAELKELAQTEQATLRRYQDAQARVRHTEDRCAELEVMVSQLETRNKIITEKNTQLDQQMEEVRARCNDAWSHKVEALKKEMDELKRTHEEQMHQLYAKVKVAVARKDSAIQALTRETAKYQEKITLLEQKLQQQRKDFLKHK